MTSTTTIVKNGSTAEKSRQFAPTIRWLKCYFIIDKHTVKYKREMFVILFLITDKHNQANHNV